MVAVVATAVVVAVMILLFLDTVMLLGNVVWRSCTEGRIQKGHAGMHLFLSFPSAMFVTIKT